MPDEDDCSWRHGRGPLRGSHRPRRHRQQAAPFAVESRLTPGQSSSTLGPPCTSPTASQPACGRRHSRRTPSCASSSRLGWSACWPPRSRTAHPRGADVVRHASATRSCSRRALAAARWRTSVGRDPRPFVVHDSRPGWRSAGPASGGRSSSSSGRGRPAAGRARPPSLRRRSRRRRSLPVAEFLGSDDVALSLHPEEAFTWDERGSEAARVLREAGGALPLVPTEPR